MKHKELLESLNQGVIDSLPDAARQNFQLVFKAVDAPAVLASLHELLTTELPGDLQDLYLYTGAARHASGAWGNLNLYSATEIRQKIATHATGMGLIRFIDQYWGGRPEFDDLDPAAIETLNHDLLVIGVRQIDDNVHVYLYVDRTDGRYGSFLLDQDDIDLDALCALADGKRLLLDSLEDLLTQQFNAIRDQLERR